MPNQRSANKRVVTVSLPKSLVAAVDKLAKSDRRSRTQMIELLLEHQLCLDEPPAVYGSPVKKTNHHSA